MRVLKKNLLDHQKNAKLERFFQDNLIRKIYNIQIMDKEEKRENAKKRIDQLFDRLEDLEEKFKNASETRKLELKREMDEVRKLRDDLQTKYADLQQATESSAKEIKSAFEQSANIFRERLNNISQTFRRENKDSDDQDNNSSPA